jgi:hypothetical protein
MLICCQPWHPPIDEPTIFVMFLLKLMMRKWLSFVLVTTHCRVRAALVNNRTTYQSADGGTLVEEILSKVGGNVPNKLPLCL